MGSYDVIVKLEEIHKRVEESNYQSALKILDTIDKKKIKNFKNTSDLSLLAEVYEENELYDDAMELLDKIYAKCKTRKVLYQIIWVCIKSNRINEAQEYMEEYERIAPQDYFNYVFRYKVDKINGVSYEKLIRTLEDMKKIEFREQWAYELAKCYYKAGLEDKCVRECSDIILWFGEGIYVEKAKMLRAYFSGETDKVKVLEALRKKTYEEINGITTGNEQEEGSKPEGNPRVWTEIEEEEPKEILTEEETRALEDNLMMNIHSIFTEEIARGGSDSGQSDAPEPEQDMPMDLSSDGENIEYSHKEQGNYPEGEPVNTGTDRASEGHIENSDDTYGAAEEIAEKELLSLFPDLGINMADVFGEYLQTKAVKEQLLHSLQVILEEQTKSVMLFITGLPGSGKTKLVKAISVFLYKARKLKTSKIAKITAEKLNKIDVMDRKETLRDCCLVVEDASELTSEKLDQIIALMEYYQGDIAVVFEDSEWNMQKLFRLNPSLAQMFKNRICLSR